MPTNIINKWIGFINVVQKTCNIDPTYMAIIVLFYKDFSLIIRSTSIYNILISLQVFTLINSQAAQKEIYTLNISKKFLLRNITFKNIFNVVIFITLYYFTIHNK